MTVSPSITRSAIPHQSQVTDQNVKDQMDTSEDVFEICCALRAAQLEDATKADIAEFTTDGQMPSTPPKKPSKRERRIKRRIVARKKARAKRLPVLANKIAPPKDIPMEGSVKRQIWVKKRLKASTNWNRVAFDHDTFIEFNKLVAMMPTKRRAWFRRKFYYAGVVDTKPMLAAA